MKITPQMMRLAGACEPGVNEFEVVWPKGAIINKEKCRESD